MALQPKPWARAPGLDGATRQSSGGEPSGGRIAPLGLEPLKSLMLQPGIRIQTLDPRLSFEGIIELSSGVDRPLAPLGVTDTDVAVAREDWAPLPRSLENILLANYPTPLPDSVSLLRVRNSFREKFWSQVAPFVLSASSQPKSARQAVLQAFCNELMSWLSSAGYLKCLSFRSADIQVTPSGRKSTAFDYVRRAYVGLHVDDHQDLTLTNRRRAFQVLCVNLGNEERYFSFVNIPLPDIARWLFTREKLRFSSLSSREIKSNFFKYFLDYPIVRVKLAPNWAYVATTQYLVHDGLPNDQDALDVALLISGYFEHPEIGNESSEQAD